MKTYLAITGILFAILAVMHLARAILSWNDLATDPGYVLSMAALGIVTALLGFWAWRLYREPVKS